jgi:hypothetical protein
MLAGCAVVTLLAAVPSAHPADAQDPAAVPERLVFVSIAAKDTPQKIELVDPVGGGATPLVTAATRNCLYADPTWSDDSKTIAFNESCYAPEIGRGVVLKPVGGGPEKAILPGDNARRGPANRGEALSKRATRAGPLEG